MAKKSRKRLPNLGIEYLFGSVALLRILSNFKVNLALYKANYDAHDSSEVPPNFLEGFKFAIIAILHRIIIDCIESPELVGVRRDANISQAYLWGKAEARLFRKLSGRSSHGILIANLLVLREAVLRAKSWDVLRSEFVRIIELIEWFEAIFSACYTAFSEEDKNQSLDPNDVLAAKLPSVLLIFLNDGRNLTRAFIEMYRTNRFRRTRIDLRRFTRSLETDLWEREVGLDTLMKDRSFLEGFKFADLVLWHKVIGEDLYEEKKPAFEKLRATVNWKEFDRLFEALLDDVVAPWEETKRTRSFYLSKTKKVPTTLSKRLISPLKLPKRRQQTLDSIFYHLPARVVSYKGSNGAMNFVMALLGLAHANIIGLMKDKAKVVEFIHRRKYGNNYSYALFLPCRGSFFSDYSQWWVFYNCATDHSGTGSFNHRMIQLFIKRYRKQISLRRRRIGERDLLKCLKSDYVKFIEEESKKATDINALMRGALLEILVALYFSKKGFDVHVRYKSPALGKEYDVVAIKEGGVNSNVIHIVECKERSVTTDPEEFSRLANEHLEKVRKKLKSKGPIGVTPADIVFKEILDFRNSIEEVRKNVRKLAHELEIKDDRNIELKGILVTTELYSAPPEVTPDVEFWTWWTLKEKLSAVGIDKSFFEIIEKHLRGEIGRPITDLHFYKDYFD